MRAGRIRGTIYVLALALLFLTSPLLQHLSAEMVAHIIDVGQGDATLLELPGDETTPRAQVLVDGDIPLIQSDLFLPFTLHSFGDPVPTPTPSPTPTPTPEAPVVEAWVSNGTPARFSTVTVYGRIHSNGVGIPGVPMHAVWHYRTTSPDCDGQSDADGVASCARNIGGASTGHYVRVVVTFTYAGQTYVAETGFTPQ
jgi:hypothetical protein